MIPVSKTITGIADSTGIPMDTYISPFNVGFGVQVTGTVTYTVMHTFDGTNWFAHATVAGQSTSQDGNYAFPVLQIRLSVTAGTGTAVLTVIQAGMPGK
jgi:hypothetical protein